VAKFRLQLEGVHNRKRGRTGIPADGRSAASSLLSEAGAKNSVRPIKSCKRGKRGKRAVNQVREFSKLLDPYPEAFQLLLPVQKARYK